MDLQAAEQWMLGVVRAVEFQPAEQQAISGQISAALGAARNWTAELKKAGAERIYVVVNEQQQGKGAEQGQPQKEQQQQTAVAVVVPLDAGDDPQAIAKLLQPSDNQDVPVYARPQTSVMHGAVVLADEKTLQRLQTAKPGDAATLMQAMQSVSDASAQIAFRPTRRLEQGLQAIAPAVPARIGEPLSKLRIQENVDWAALGIDLPQKQAVKLVIDAKSPEAAEQLAAEVNRILEGAQQQNQSANNPAAAQTAAGVQMLKPTVEGQRLNITLSNEQAERFIEQGLQSAVQSTMTPGAGGSGAHGAQPPAQR